MTSTDLKFINICYGSEKFAFWNMSMAHGLSLMFLMLVLTSRTLQIQRTIFLQAN